MWLTRYLPSFSGLNESSLSASPPCKNCTRKRWLLSTEGLLAAGGICLGTRVALKGQSEGIKAAFTTGALCICFVNSVLLHFPVTKPSSWACMLTGGMLSGAGIGWCLTVAFKEQPKSTILAYMAGAISICLTNSIMFHVPSCYESIQKVSKPVSLQPGKNSQTRVESLGRLKPRTAEVSLAIKATTNTGLQQNKREFKRKRCMKRELKPRKRALQTQCEKLISGSQSGNVPESLDSFNAPPPAEGSATVNAPPPAEGSATVNAPPPAEGSAIVVHKDNDEYSGDKTTDDDAVGVKSISRETYHARKSDDLSTSEFVDESAKGEAAIFNRVSVCPSQSADECSEQN